MYLIEMLRKYGVLPSKIGGNEAMAEEFDAPTERMASITPLLYQSGYVTIKNADTDFGIYRLDIPNKEVRIGLMRISFPIMSHPDTLTATTTIVNLARALVKGDMEGMLQLLQTFLSTVPYCDPYGLRKPLPTDALYHFQPLRHVCGRGSPYPEGTGGHGDAHGYYTLHRGAEIEPIRRSRHAANRPEKLSRTLCLVRPARGESRH